MFKIIFDFALEMAEGEIEARQPLASRQHRNRVVSLQDVTIQNTNLRVEFAQPQGEICAILACNLRVELVLSWPLRSPAIASNPPLR